MILDIIDCAPYRRPEPAGPQVIHVVYTPEKNCTIITIDADVVTIGLAAQALLHKWERELVAMNPENVAEMRRIIMKAVSDCG